MFTNAQKVLLIESVATQIAVVRRRINVEKNDGIKEILRGEVSQLEELKSMVYSVKESK